MGDNTAIRGTFRQFLPDLSLLRFKTMQKQDARQYARSFIEGGKPPWIHALYLHWRQLFAEPFKGITNDGTVRSGLFRLQDEGVGIEAVVDSAKNVVAGLDPQQLLRVKYHIDSPEWRTWSNPEFLLSDKGIRLDEVSDQVRTKVVALLETAISPEGYLKALGAMRMNGFLGELVKSPAVMNEYSYNFALFGEPSITDPWGFSFYGHHLCLNIFFYRSQIVISPWFTGAEPNIIDDGPYKGTRILHEEERLGLQLMQSLSANQQTRAQVYKQLRDPAMRQGRWNHDDQRHLCGAYRDNRIVPYEGIVVTEMNTKQRELIFLIFEQYLLFLPDRAREMRIRELKQWLGETYFSWIGGFGDNDAFYYRIQSPVIIVEFDHHSGVFLTNKEPAKFHIHTLLRTPNGGDYGMALRPLIPGMEQGFTWEGEKI